MNRQCRLCMQVVNLHIKTYYYSPEWSSCFYYYRLRHIFYRASCILSQCHSRIEEVSGDENDVGSFESIIYIEPFALNRKY